MLTSGLLKCLCHGVNSVFLKRSTAFFAIGVMTALAVGCGQSGLTGTSVVVPGFAGNVHGGQQPISGATIQLYAVGTQGDGSAATPLIASPTKTNSKGQFDVGAYVCPSASTNVYLTATSGNPGLQAGTLNPAIAALVALGPCGNITASTYINVDEMSTVAAVFALSPFMASTTEIGSGQTDAPLLDEAFALAGELVSTSTGAVPGPALPVGQTVPAAKMRALANILSTCVNSAGGVAGDGSNCGTLFALTAAGAGRTPVDTAQALLGIAKNPVVSVSALYLLSPAISPFLPTLTSPPSDWTIVPTSPTPAPVFSLPAGSYAAGTPVALSDSSANAVIYYTTDGSTPSKSSHLYSGALSLTASGMLRAVAIAAGVSSLPVTQSYTIVTPAISISPSAVSLKPSQTQMYAASVSGLLNTGVTWSMNPAVGSLSSGGVYTAPASLAAAQAVTITATSVSEPSLAASSVISLMPGATAVATHLAFMTQPSDANVGTNISPAVTVMALDASGNAVTGTSYPVKLAIQTNAGSGALTGTTSVATSAGAAVFSNLSLTAAGTGYTLVATSPGLTSATSAGFNVNSASSAVAATYSGKVPVSALAFTDTVGINVHLNFGNTLYTNNFPLILSSLQALGIHHVRDGLLDYGSGPTDYYKAHNTLGANGIKTDYITSIGESPSVIKAYPTRVNDMEAVEAPNEYDASGDPNWALNLGAYLPVLFSTVHGASPMTGVTLLGPSLVDSNWYASNNSYATLGLISSLFDQGNLHNYPGGRNPGTPGWTPQGYGSIAWAISAAESTWFSTPLTTTEIGYYDDASLTNSVPDAVIASYVPRLFLEQYLHGITRTYLYELADDLPGGNYGLLRADGSQKPAYPALLNFMHLLSDPGVSYSTKPLVYGISGSAPDVHQMLFQKRDGSYLLALWIEEPGYDVNAKKVLNVPTRSASVNFSTATQVQGVYEQQPGGTSTTIVPSTGKVYSLPVTLSDEITMVEIAAP